MLTFHFMGTTEWPFALEHGLGQLELQQLGMCEGPGSIWKVTSASLWFILIANTVLNIGSASVYVGWKQRYQHNEEENFKRWHYFQFWDGIFLQDLNSWKGYFFVCIYKFNAINLITLVF